MDDAIAKMGEVVFSGPGVSTLRALGLGSCIGLCAFDPVTKHACLAHIVLPKSKTTISDLGKYADTAVPYVVEQMTSRGVLKSRLRFAIAGGAQLFNFEGAGERLDVGKRNAEAVTGIIKDMKLRLVAADVGGKSGRTVALDTATGEVTVKLVGGEMQHLAHLSR